jgi:prevent-host-death family protein
MEIMQNKTDDDKAAKREEVPVVEARNRLGELLDRAGFLGERIVITRNGKPLVALVSMADLATIEAAEATERAGKSEDKPVAA